MPIIGVIASSAKGAPGIPTIGTATNVGTGRAYNNGAATVTFTAGAGATATSFTATSSPGGFTATGASSPLTVAGLQSSTSYTFTVTATNASGTSAASSASNSITATTVPQAPTIGTATAGNASATVTYTAGATGGAAVSVYTATSTPGSLTGTGASPITVSGLTNGTAYTFTVTATNANGTSAASAASNSVTPVVPSSFESIATITSSGSAQTISSIPSGYKMLQLRIWANSTTGSDSGCFLTVNGTNMFQIASQVLGSRNASVYTGSTTAASGNSFYLRNFGAATTGAPTIINFYDYDNTGKFKPFDAIMGFFANTSSDGSVESKSGVWASTSAITSITITAQSGSIRAGSSMALYGMK
jgi:uncharacterized protein YccT (UPF0319 family)